MEYRTSRHRTILAWSVCRSQGKCGGTATWILGKAFYLCLPWQCSPVTQGRPPSYSIRTAAPEYTGLLSAQPEGIEVVLRAHAEAPASNLKPAKQGILQQTELTSSLTRRSSKGSMVRLPPLPPSCLAAVTAGCLALPHLVSLTPQRRVRTTEDLYAKQKHRPSTTASGSRLLRTQARQLRSYQDLAATKANAATPVAPRAAANATTAEHRSRDSPPQGNSMTLSVMQPGEEEAEDTQEWLEDSGHQSSSFLRTDVPAIALPAHEHEAFADTAPPYYLQTHRVGTSSRTAQVLPPPGNVRVTVARASLPASSKNELLLMSGRLPSGAATARSRTARRKHPSKAHHHLTARSGAGEPYSRADAADRGNEAAGPRSGNNHSEDEGATGVTPSDPTKLTWWQHAAESNAPDTKRHAQMRAKVHPSVFRPSASRAWLSMGLQAGSSTKPSTY